MVSLHRACCHHKVCSVQHKSFGEKRERGVVWGLLLGFSSVGEVWHAWQASNEELCVLLMRESSALQHV